MLAVWGLLGCGVADCLAEVRHAALAPAPAPVAAVELNDPQGTHEMPALNGDEVVRLSGRIQCLKVAGLNGRAVLDASGLTVERVLFTGAVNGEACITVSAPEGRVVFQEAINGNPRLRLESRFLEFQAPVNGSGRIEAAFGRDGELKFLELAGSTEILCRPAGPGGALPVITTGRILGSAKVAQIHP